MVLRLIVLATLLISAVSANAAEQFVLNFKVTQNDKIIEKGNVIVLPRPLTWSKGLKRSYLKLSCKQQSNGKMQKLYSTEDYFYGLQISRQLFGDIIEVKVLHNRVKNRLLEIRALAKNECKELSPVLTTRSETYRFSTKSGVEESRPFGENLSFKAKIYPLN